VPVLEFRLELPGVLREELWAFHGDPAVLTLLTPPGKQVEVAPRTGPMGEGAVVVLTVRQFGLPLTWVSRIVDWTPPARFADVQEKGPFARWRHDHIFEDGRLVDRVDYEVPFASAGGRLVDRFLVRPDLVRMFAHRHRVTREALTR
jgi:ligand-binding SRPBCC domain-containing protein